ncbi:hypothetical protein, partial [Staphylococcus succinus]|uniref:hypothetical protein n=1 Tax=Staphylococcus succinus TaxID=61015 RepID=UPI001A7E141F
IIKGSADFKNLPSLLLYISTYAIKRGTYQFGEMMLCHTQDVLIYKNYVSLLNVIRKVKMVLPCS